MGHGQRRVRCIRAMQFLLRGEREEVWCCRAKRCSPQAWPWAREVLVGLAAATLFKQAVDGCTAALIRHAWHPQRL